MKSWTFIENCEVCCRYDLAERDNLNEIPSSKVLALINSMTNNDGWFTYFDKSNRKYMIYESRQHFCRVNEFSKALKGYLKKGDKFLIDCFTQHISSIYEKKVNK